MNWGPCESQSPTGKSQERGGAKGKEEELGGGNTALLPSCQSPFRFTVSCDSILQVRTNTDPPLDRDDRGSEPRVIQKVVDPRLIMTIVTINSSNCSL